MFSYAASLYSYLTGQTTDDDDIIETENKEPDENQDDTAVPVNPEDQNKQTLNGKITSFFNNRGLINDHIYFTQSAVLGNELPQVGDDVIAETSRQHSAAGWIATKVQINCVWDIDDTDDDKPYKDIVIGTVVQHNRTSVVIKTISEITVSSKKLKANYYPFQGDYVQMEVWQTKMKPDDVIRALIDDDIISVSPLREKKVHGHVTEIIGRYGFINDDVYFSFAVCERSYKPRKGDSVVANVIESKQKRGDWRAVSVFTKDKKVIEKHEKASMDNSREKMKDSHGVIVNVFSDLYSCDMNKPQDVLFKVSNNGSSQHLFVGMKPVVGVTLQLNSEVESIKQTASNNTLSNRKLLYPSSMIDAGQTKTLLIKFQPQNLGRVSVQLELLFEGFHITTSFTANVTDNMQKNITPTSTFEKTPVQNTFFGKAVNHRLADGCVVPGQRLVRKKKTFLPNKLSKYPVPSHLKNCIHVDGDLEHLVPELAKPLHVSTYKKKFSTLLYIEEIQQEDEMRQYDLYEVLLRPVSEFLSLNVPGLSEGRPSLLLGDRVVIKYRGDSNSPSYEGYIHEVHAEDILLKFSEELHNKYFNENVDVEFYFNRTPIRRAHQAVENAMNLGEEVIFPKTTIIKDPVVELKNGKIRPFNKLLNKRQLMAVSRIVSGYGRPTPYILFGPPGTGKSVTVVESILQVFKHVKYSRILACAPSNSAADLIGERLHRSGLIRTCDMVRLNAFQRSTSNLPECLEPYCVSDTDDLKLASRYRIIICTCSMAGFLYSFNLKPGHFTHVFVDEAGQATEPECLIPIGFTAGSEDSQIILAGDPFQLGPVLRSDIAGEYGLGLSFLERLTDSKLYERNEDLYEECYNPLVVTKLVNNYRSHADLLSLSSRMFYNNELIPCADTQLVNKYIGAPFLPNKDIPFIFHGLRSDDFREGNSPSWFNPMEAVQVIKYVQLLLNTPPRVVMDDIGIITPYRKQVEKIRVLLNQFNLNDIKVGSVEEFQGQERQCIILSTVRSKEELVDFDCYHNVGFLSNSKRFNVSITRAQALLVIVGNPVVLCYDAYWCGMLQYAVMNGCYTGCQLPALNHEIVQERGTSQDVDVKYQENFRKAMVLLGFSSANKNISEENCDGVKQDEREICSKEDVNKFEETPVECNGVDIVPEETQCLSAAKNSTTSTRTTKVKSRAHRIQQALLNDQTTKPGQGDDKLT